MVPAPDDIDPDEQDQSEVFDEDNQEIDDAGSPRADMKTLEEIPDVYDVTSAVGDSDDDAGRIAEDMDAAEIIDLEADAEAADFEDDELAARMPEALRRAADIDESSPAADEPRLIYRSDVEHLANDDREAAAFEAERLADRDIAELGYADAGAADDGEPRGPSELRIRLRGGLWALTRDGVKLHEYTRVERAIREAGELARELRSTGEPAIVYLHDANDRVIEVTDDDPPATPPDEASAVLPDRSASA